MMRENGQVKKLEGLIEEYMDNREEEEEEEESEKMKEIR